MELTRAENLLSWFRERRDDMVDLLAELATLESPSHDAAAQAPVQARLRAELEELGFAVRHCRGTNSAGHLWARPRAVRRPRRAQLLLGHSDTVWPRGTLETMPVRRDDGCLHGPGTYDMKAGLVQALFAVRALADLHVAPPLTPVFFINSDEEIGSPESAHVIRLIAPRVRRAFVMEPSLGPDGRLKTGRKGVGRFTLTARGRAAHAGLDPDKGRSAVLEMAHQVVALHALNDSARGITVNAGTIEGGTRPNVIAAQCRVVVDVRVLTHDDATEVESAIRALRPRIEGTTLTVDGGMKRPPLEATPGNRTLWAHAQRAANALGFGLDQGTAGGGSDGNFTSEATPTLDGLGAVGAGAHADHEHVVIDRMPERAALLALLMTAPA